MQIRNKIREYRNKKGLTLVELAEKLNVSYPHLSQLERHQQYIIKNLDVDLASKELGADKDDLFEVVT